MRIVDIRETAIPLKSNLRNSSFDFTEMTTSVVAVDHRRVRGGKPVCGFAFNSTGRYACGAAMRARFIPRILAADPAYVAGRAGLLDPAKILACMMQREKAGGHSERSIAIGTIEVAVWDALAKIADKPLYRLLAERFNGGKVPDKVFCYVGGGWYWPGQTIQDLQDEMRRHLDAGYTMVKMKVGGLPLDEDLRRLEAVLRWWARASISPSTPIANSPRRGARLCQGARPVQVALVRGAVRPARLRADRGTRGRSMRRRWRPAKTCSPRRRRKPRALRRLAAGGNDVIQIDPPQAYGITQYARTLTMLEGRGWPRASLFPHGGNQMSLAIAAGFGLGGAESYPGRVRRFRRLCRRCTIKNGAITLSDRPGIGFEGQAGSIAS